MGSRAVLQAVLDESGTPRKSIAQDVLGRDDEPQFSKMVGGTRPWDLDHLDRLPRKERVEWLKRRAEAEGLEVRDPDILAAAYRIVGLYAEIEAAARLLKLPEKTDGQIKSEIQARQARKVG